MTTINEQFNELVGITLVEKQQLTENNNNEDNLQPELMDKSGKIPDFFQDNKSSVEKTERKYTTTRIKLRNFLSNISYVGINKEDFYNENFIFDVYLLITKNLNPFLLDQKLTDQNKHQMIYKLWKECMPQKFHKHNGYGVKPLLEIEYSYELLKIFQLFH